MLDFLLLEWDVFMKFLIFGIFFKFSRGAVAHRQIWPNVEQLSLWEIFQKILLRLPIYRAKMTNFFVKNVRKKTSSISKIDYSV